MNCPFCEIPMNHWNIDNQVKYQCSELICRFGLLSRYKVNVNKETGKKLVEMIIMDDRFYVEIDHDKGRSSIHKIKDYTLFDGITILNSLHLDLQNYPAALNKIKTLVNFS